jgi:hypothetical protein
MSWFERASDTAGSRVGVREEGVVKLRVGVAGDTAAAASRKSQRRRRGIAIGGARAGGRDDDQDDDDDDKRASQWETRG